MSDRFDPEAAMEHSLTNLECLKENFHNGDAWESPRRNSTILFYGFLAICNALYAIIGQLMQMHSDEQEKLEQVRLAIANRET